MGRHERFDQGPGRRVPAAIGIPFPGHRTMQQALVDEFCPRVVRESELMRRRKKREAERRRDEAKAFRGRRFDDPDPAS